MPPNPRQANTKKQAAADKRPAPDKGLARDIRRQAGDRATRRFLRSLPSFKVVTELPEHLRNLLEQLESVDPTAGRSKSG